MPSTPSIHSLCQQAVPCAANAVSSTSNDSGFDTGDSTSSDPQLLKAEAAVVSRSSSVEVLDLSEWTDERRHSAEDNFDSEKAQTDSDEAHLRLLPCGATALCSSFSADQTHNKGSFASGRFSNSTSSIGRPLCRICHLVHDSPLDPMISPCRCAGTMQYVHTACLVHWLEISARKMYPSPRCELCQYNYRRHHCIDPKRLHLPRVAARDIALNVVFVFFFIVMITCAALCARFLRVTDDFNVLRPYNKNAPIISGDDLVVLTSSVLFFTAFFVAIFTQYRAETSLFRVMFRCWLINRNWRIRNYDPDDDVEMAAERRARLGTEGCDAAHAAAEPFAPAALVEPRCLSP